MQKFMQLWEQAPVVGDPAKTVTNKIQAGIKQQVSKTPTGHQNMNPTAIVNKAVIDAAAEDPLNVTDALNKNQPQQKTMKKMKKEHHFLTFEEFRRRQQEDK